MFLFRQQLDDVCKVHFGRSVRRLTLTLKLKSTTTTSNAKTHTLIVVLKRISALDVTFTLNKTITPPPAPVVVELIADEGTPVRPEGPVIADSKEDIESDVLLNGGALTLLTAEIVVSRDAARLPGRGSGRVERGGRGCFARFWRTREQHRRESKMTKTH